MKKIIISVLTIFCWLYATAITKNNVKTPESVARFINCVEKLSEVNEETAIQLRNEMIKCFASQKTYGIDFDDRRSGNSSEFPFLGFSTASVSNSSSYCVRLYTYIYTNKILKIKHQVLNTDVINTIGDDGKDERYFYSTTLKEICSYNNTTKNLWQNIEVPVGDNEPIVRLVTYEYKPESIVDAYEKDYATNINVQEDQHKQEGIQRRELSEREYLHLAARYYTTKNYERMYDLLKEMTEIYDMNAEGWYRLALLVYYHPRLFEKIYSNPREVAKSLAKKAENRADEGLKFRISNRLDKWENRGFYR